MILFIVCSVAHITSIISVWRRHVYLHCYHHCCSFIMWSLPSCESLLIISCHCLLCQHIISCSSTSLSMVSMCVCMIMLALSLLLLVWFGYCYYLMMFEFYGCCFHSHYDCYFHVIVDYLEPSSWILALLWWPSCVYDAVAYLMIMLLFGAV